MNSENGMSKTGSSRARTLLRQGVDTAREHHCTYLAAFFVWAIGVIWASTELVIHSGTYINSDNIGKLSPVLFFITVIQLLLGFIDQFLAFKSIHDLDTNPTNWSKEFPNWLGRRSEWMLRIMIVFCLLAVSGEIPILIKHIVEGIYEDRRVLPIFVYPLSATLLYLLMTIWDVGGIKHGREMRNGLSEQRLKDIDYWLQFIISDLLALVFWLSILIITLMKSLKDYFPSLSNLDGSYFVLVPLATLLLFAITMIYRLGHIYYSWRKPQTGGAPIPQI